MTSEMVKANRALNIKPPAEGWGGELYVRTTEKRQFVAYEGEETREVAEKIANVIGATLLDTTGLEEVDLGTLACAVIKRDDHGKYLWRSVATINLNGQVAPKAYNYEFISKENYVAGEPVMEAVEIGASTGTAGFMKPVIALSTTIGSIVDALFEGAAQALNMILKMIIPCFAFAGLLIGIITYSGLGTMISNVLSPFVSTLPGMLMVVIITSLPFISPIVAPGAAITGVCSILLGEMIGAGTFPAHLALPAFFAIDGMIGCDFVPVAMSYMDAEKETITAAYPAYLFSNFICGPLAVLVAYGYTMLTGMYQ